VTHEPDYGQMWVWDLDGLEVAQIYSWITLPQGSNYYVVGLGDFDDNGYVDVVWHENGTSDAVIELVSGGETIEQVELPNTHPNLETPLDDGWRGRNGSDATLQLE